MLFHTLYAPGSGVYVQQIVGSLHEELHGSAFRQAWQWVVDRHPVLRTGVSFADSGELLQRVHANASLAIEEHDWRGTDVSERDERLRLYVDADRRRGFELEAAPLMRLAFFRMARADHRFVWTSHHALLDGRSRLRVLTELFSAYDAFRRSEAPRCEPARPYRDYIEWLRAQDVAEAERFWRRMLRGFTAPTPLVVDAVSPSVSPDDGFAARRVRLSESSTVALRRLARRHGSTLNTFVQGAWALLLNRYSGEDDIVFGATQACRKPEARPGEVWVGLFINTLPVRVRVSSDDPLIPWLRRLRAQWSAKREYEHTPLVNVHECSEVPAGTPLFESVVVYEYQTLESALREQGEHWAGRGFRLIQATNYPLTVSAFGEPELLLDIGFDRRRFESATIDRMLGHLLTLLEGMAAHPEARLSELPILSQGEQRRMLVEWNDTETDYPTDRCVHELFEEQVERTPDAVAVTFGEEHLTYRELNRRANRLARHLRKLGVGPEVLVGVCVERSLEMVVGLLGVLKAGGAYVPLDPTYPKERLSFMLEDARAPVLLTQERLVEGLPDNHGTRVVRLDADWPVVARESQENLVPEASADALAYVIYTSGSTGSPKGVLGLHKGLVNRFAWMWDTYPFEVGEVCCQKTSLSFVDSIWEIFGPLLQGIRIVIIPNETVSSPPDLARTLAINRVSRIVLVPSLLRALLAYYADSKSGMPKPKIWVSSGEPLTPELSQRFREAMPESTLLNLYGSSEVSADVTCYEATSKRENLARMPIGRPIANTCIYLLDGRMRPVPIGVPGELHVGGEGLARGYLDRPELTEERFVPDPFSDEPGARLYRTGDLARYLPDGNIEFLGRTDYQVKVRGYRIELGEVETALDRHPAVRETVVVAREEALEQKRLVAYVVPAHQPTPTTSELRGFLREKLPEYMVPSLFVVLEALPRTPNGKVDRRALPTPEPPGDVLAEADVQPRTPVEELLSGIWTEVLELEQVDIHDNFFELGGHSLLATRVASRVREAFGIELPLVGIFEAPTVAGLAEGIEAARRSDPVPPAVAPGSDNLEELRF